MIRSNRRHEGRIWPTTMHRIIEIIYNHPYLNSRILFSGKEEPFVPCHSDVDLEKLLFDDHGNVTSVLDWQEIVTTPGVSARLHSIFSYMSSTRASRFPSCFTRCGPSITVAESMLMSWNSTVTKVNTRTRE
jgi:hypothetical protein